MVLVKFSVNRLVRTHAQLSISSRRWNNYVKNFIYLKYRNFYLLNLYKTLYCLRLTSFFLTDIIQNRGSLLFIDNRLELQMMLKYLKIETSQNFMTYKWVSGSFTNFVEFYFNKKLALNLDSDLRHSGFYSMSRLPDVIVSFSLYENYNAITEARTLGIPVISLIGSDMNPSGINFMLFSNDINKKSIFLFTQVFRYSVLRGFNKEKIFLLKILKKYSFLLFLKKLLKISKKNNG